MDSSLSYGAFLFGGGYFLERRRSNSSELNTNPNSESYPQWEFSEHRPYMGSLHRVMIRTVMILWFLYPTP